MPAIPAHAARVPASMATPSLFQDQEQQADRQERAAGEAKLASIEERLLARDGPPPPRAFFAPLKELVYVLISARTRTEVSLAVLAELELAYGAALGDWRGLRDAPPGEVERLLAPVTFAERKAPALQAALRRITRQNGGVLSLDFFEGQPVERIRRWLESFEGVGARGSAAVANHSSLRLRALAIDGHHHRIGQRLGFATKHDLWKRHGQVRCTAVDWERNCPGCPLLPLCPAGAFAVKDRSANESFPHA